MKWAYQPVTPKTASVALRRKSAVEAGDFEAEVRQPQGLVLVVDDVIHRQWDGLELAVGEKTGDDGVGVADVGHEKSAVVEK